MSLGSPFPVDDVVASLTGRKRVGRARTRDLRPGLAMNFQFIQRPGTCLPAMNSRPGGILSRALYLSEPDFFCSASFSAAAFFWASSRSVVGGTIPFKRK